MISPEVWRDQPYDNKSDVWSLGCVLYEMTTLKPPFRAEDMEGLYKKVLKGFLVISKKFHIKLRLLLENIITLLARSKQCYKITFTSTASFKAWLW